MVTSMTGFARQAGTHEWRYLIWEIRSVNHRFLDITIRLPDELRGIESGVRELISQHIHRGKVECTLYQDVHEFQKVDLVINETLLKELINTISNIRFMLENPAPIDILELMRWPGLIEVKAMEVNRLSGPLLEMLQTTLVALDQDRKREGAKLFSMISERCVSALLQIDNLRKVLPSILQAIKERYLSRTRDLGLNLDPGRLEQEMLILAQKLDIAEEMDRLSTHIEEVHRLLEHPEPIGRRLDFLMQEMNREANTIASKSSHTETTGASVELKVLIEQMREQIQNIE